MSILTNENLKVYLGVEADDALLNLLTEQSKQIIINYVYPFGAPEDFNFPKKWETNAFQLVIYLFNKLGIEGQTAHKEQDIERTYGDSNIPTYVFSGLNQNVGVL